jgi:ubiquinone/menaquinone biosynthesis C-methylase UbiE
MGRKRVGSNVKEPAPVSSDENIEESLTKKMKKEVKNSEVAEAADNYSSAEYWNNRYCVPCDNTADTTTDILSHEWYYTYDELAPLILKQDLFKHLQDFSRMKVLEVGCGNKTLIQHFDKLLNEKEQLRYFENDQLYGIDFSDNVIKQLNESQAKNKKKIHYVSMDARHLAYDDDHFDFIIDKGTMDAMLSEKQKKKGIANATQLISEMIRVLSTSHGCLMIISHIEIDTEEYELFLHDILSPLLLDVKKGVIWKLNIHSVQSGQEETGSQYGTVYCLTCCERRVTRDKSQIPNEILVEIHEYSDEEEENDDEEQQEEN